MNLFQSPSARLALSAAFGVLLASTASAQRAISTPYSLENGGLIDAIWWDVSGGQNSVPGGFTKSPFLSLTGGCSIYDNGPIYKWLASNLAGGPTPYSCTMSRGGPRQTVSLDGTFSHRMTGLVPVRIVYPGGNASLKETRNTLITADASGIQADPTYAPNPSLNMTARKQKSWLCSNFRLRLGDLPCNRVSQYDPLILDFVPGGDLDGDGAPDRTIKVTDISFVIPEEDSPLFLDQFRKSLSGSPSSLPLAVDYLDDDGFVLMTISMTVQIRSVGPVDMFTNPLAGKEKEVQVTVHHSGESKPLQIKIG